MITDADEPPNDDSFFSFTGLTGSCKCKYDDPN